MNIIESVTNNEKKKEIMIVTTIHIMDKHHDSEITAVLISTDGHVGRHYGCTCKIFLVPTRVLGEYFKIEF